MVKYRREWLDEQVREAARLDPRRTEALDDARSRQALLERIVATPRDRGAATTHPRRRRPLAFAVAAGVAVVVAGASVAGVVFVQRDRPVVSSHATASARQTPGHRGDAFGTNGQSQSCVARYGRKALAGAGFAFDGTVESIGKRHGGDAYPYAPVTFVVQHWYRGGSAGRVTVSMLPPGHVTSVGNAVYGVGSRLLVAGAPRHGDDPTVDPVAWACGFTRWYTEDDARVWGQVFGPR